MDTNNNGTWSEQKERLKKKFSILTDRDLSFDAGKRDLMLGKLREKLGRSKKELTYILETI